MVDREKVIKALQNCSVQNDFGCQQCPFIEERKTYGHEWCTTAMAQDALELLKEQETELRKLRSDVVELTGELAASVRVVRCKDCKHWKRRECGTYGTCENDNMNLVGFFDADWFCADGERSE